MGIDWRRVASILAGATLFGIALRGFWDVVGKGWDALRQYLVELPANGPFPPEVVADLRILALSVFLMLIAAILGHGWLKEARV